MKNITWYIDPDRGNNENTGTSPTAPLKSWRHLEPGAGDSILFSRGSVIREALEARSGVEGAQVTYGAYGEGPRPAFLGSVAVSDPALWSEVKPSVWRCGEQFFSEVCNIIFDGGRVCGNLRWSIDELENPGEWYYTGLGTSKITSPGDTPDLASCKLFICSPTNPGKAWSSIECALWGGGAVARGKRHVIFEDLCFKNSGVHGYQDSHVEDVVIRNCEFRDIGGAVWSLEHQVRFGNACELWEGASDVTVEGCLFDNIYDAGVTHQGGETRNVPERVYFRDNLFIGCGLSAYECREPSREIYFEHNTCVDSGGGFAMQGEEPPRRSEIYTVTNGEGEPVLVRLDELPTHVGDTPVPIDVGHHVFVWRVDPGTQPGQVYIRNNVFYEAPCGAAVYSIIQSGDTRKFVLDGNVYQQTSGNLLAKLSGRSYRVSDFDKMRADWEIETGGTLDEIVFVDEAGGDYRLRTEGGEPPAGIRREITDQGAKQ